MNTKENEVTPFRMNIFCSFCISVFVVVVCICVMLFVPAETPEGQIVYDEPAENSALEIAYTASFLTNQYNSTEFAPGIDPFYIQEYLNLGSVKSNDQGLDYYRNPQTRGAVEFFFIRVTGRRNVAMSILKAADRENIPLTLAFALAYTESRYNIRARNTNVNGSIDRGLFQLNDRSFPYLDEEDFFNADVSARYGMRHLRYCLSIAKEEFTAVAMYNAGVTRVKNNQTPKTTIAYVSNIAKYKSRLDADFERDVISLFRNSVDEVTLKEF